MKDLGKDSAVVHEVGEAGDGQRVDNYLVRLLKGVPRSHVYKILRSGEVRVNGGRVDATRRLHLGDKLRLPPVRTAAVPAAAQAPYRSRFIPAVLYEDEWLLALAKPAGVAVHGGSGISRGVIEEMRALRPDARFMELVHRLDRETSGVLLIAKKRAALVGLHAALREGRIRKRYDVLVSGNWQDRRREVTLPLRKYLLPGGDRRVRVEEGGLASKTIFTLRERMGAYCLLSAELITGRTHQIRVHLAHLGFPIAGDDKYGDFELNHELARGPLKRMFLHAARIGLPHPQSGATLVIEAPLPDDLARFVGAQRSAATTA